MMIKKADTYFGGGSKIHGFWWYLEVLTTFLPVSTHHLQTCRKGL